MLKPKLISLIKHREYSLAQFKADCIAGLIVGVVALPLAIAFAIASGVSPEKGIVTAIIGGFIVAVLGGSRVQIAGPTGAFVVIVFGIVHKFGLEGLYISTFLAGLLLVLLGLFRIGSLIKHMPHPIIVGFTSGIALIIFSSQIKDAFGLKIDSVPAEFLEKWRSLMEHAYTVNPAAVLMTSITVVILIFWKKVSQKLPSPLVALVVCTLLAYIFKLPVETIGSRFGDIPHHFPMPKMPDFHWDTLVTLIPSIIAITLLGGIESLLSAVVADKMIKGEHRPNMEFVAQGFANIVSPLFGGIPVTGAIARTATNVQNGGRTPVAGIVHSVALLVIMLFLGNLVKYIPLSCLAGILLVVAYNMSEWKAFKQVLKDSRSSMIIVIATFFITVLFDLTAGILTGIILSVVLRGFIRFKPL